MSDLTAAEVARAPLAVREQHAELVGLSGTILRSTPEVEYLLHKYAARRILSARFGADMRHIAIATVGAVDILVSWNFKHIVRIDRIRAFNAVNVESGYGVLRIQSSREVVHP